MTISVFVLLKHVVMFADERQTLIPPPTGPQAELVQHSCEGLMKSFPDSPGTMDWIIHI